MNVETIREYCLSKKGVTESFPFDDVSLVMKVLDKMFALIDLEGANSISLNCANIMQALKEPTISTKNIGMAFTSIEM